MHTKRLLVSMGILGGLCGCMGAGGPGKSGEAAVKEEAPPPAVVIHAENTGAPISKYVYGQFIEHLGRCIYGGIWAEMLEDRKFYYAVGVEESPWRAVGGEGAVEMIREKPYVGEQMVRIHLAADAARGIAQGELGVVAGKEYAGRVILAETRDAGPVEVALIWGDGPNECQRIAITDIKKKFAKYPIRFRAGATTDAARLEVTATGKGHVDIGTLSLMPADNVHGMRADTLAMLKELDAPVYRWPGGNFVSGYDWKDGIGDPDRRPPRKNPAWKGIEHNDFGIDEFMIYCRELDTEPLIVVNSGLGNVDSAVEELQYANGPVDSPGGKLRAANGHPEPYSVKWWGIGNEMYGDWQLGHIPLEEYVRKHNTYAEAMRAVDPSIKLIGVGATGVWSETMLGQCADHMDLLSEHFYVQDRKNVASHVRQIPQSIRAKVEAHRHYHETIPALAGKSIPICMDEWNYWYGPQPYGELGTQYFLKDALGIAAGLHEYFRSSDVVFMANYAQTVNVIGCIKTSKTAATLDTTALPLKLYRAKFGTIPVSVEGSSRPLDVMAAWTESRDAITVGVVNPTEETLPLEMAFSGATLTGTGTCWIVTGPGPLACNVPGKAPEVMIRESAVTKLGGKVEIPALSICLYRLAVQ